MFNITFDIESKYLTDCARIRNITRTTLVRRLMTIIDQDQLVGAILDDDAARTQQRYQHRFHMRGPSDAVF